jgi:hypothetical protein
MIFECPFDELVQKIGGQELINVSPRKVMGEGLVCKLSGQDAEKEQQWTRTKLSLTTPYWSHITPGLVLENRMSWCSRERNGASASKSSGNAIHLRRKS